MGDLHCNYEAVEPFPVTFAQGALELAHIPDPEKFFRVEKMKFDKVRKKDGKLEPDKTTVIYNSNITITGIPLEAYDYVVNGKAALDWVMERQCVKTDGASGIVNDANRYAIETVGDPAYPLKLFQRVITVSLETMKIVRALPTLDVIEGSVDHEPDQPMTLADVREGIAENWDDGEVVRLARSLIDALEEFGSRGEMLQTRDLLKMMGQSEFTEKVAATLTILTQSRFAVLEAHAELFLEDQDRHFLNPREIELLLAEDRLTHPISGEEIFEASSSVVLVFRPLSQYFAGDRHEW